MNTECEYCNAKFWIDERLTRSSEKSPKFGMCCKQGKVLLPLIAKPPIPLCNLLDDISVKGMQFKKYIRAYNSILAFASLGASIDETVTDQGRYSFKIQGSVYHRIGSLLPNDQCAPKFAQIYFYDTDHELENRMNLFPSLDKDTLNELQIMMHEHNKFYKQFKSLLDREHNDLEKISDLKLIIREDSGNDIRRYNAPTASEVAILMPGDGSYVGNRDIILHAKNGK